MESVGAPFETSAYPAPEREIEEWLDTARALLMQDPTAALALADRAIQTATKVEAPLLFVQALTVRGRTHGARGDIDAAQADFCEALEHSRSLADRYSEAECLHGLANVYCYRGDYARALEAMHKAVAVRREIGDEHGLMGDLNSLGAFYEGLGNYLEATDTLTASLHIARRLDDRATQAMVLGNLGFIKIHCGEPGHALEYLIESVRLGDEIGERVNQSLSRNLLARAYHLLNRLPEALANARCAVQLAVEIGNRHHEVTALPTLAMIHADLEELSTAEQCLLTALQIALDIEAGHMIAYIYRSLGLHYLKAGNLTAARHYVDKGFEYVDETQQKRYLSDLHNVSCEIFEAQGDYQHALEAYRAYTEADRARQKESAQNRMIAQLARLEVERAQQEAEIHKLRNIELAEANRKNVELLERLQQHADKLAQMAITDPLTGLYNRRYMEDHLAEEIRNARHPDTDLAVAMVDLDNFKRVNDRFGHHIGDKVLQATAQILQSTLRRVDITVRNGGEEFVLMLPGADLPAALIACERVRAAIEAYDWSIIASELQMTASIGLCHSGETESRVSGITGHDLVPLLALADERLYQAKALGKNRIVVSQSREAVAPQFPAHRRPI